MTKTVNKRVGKPKRKYIFRSNAINVTLYSQDGSALPQTAHEELEDALAEIAHRHGLLSSVAKS